MPLALAPLTVERREARYTADPPPRACARAANPLLHVSSRRVTSNRKHARASPQPHLHSFAFRRSCVLRLRRTHQGGVVGGGRRCGVGGGACVDDAAEMAGDAPWRGRDPVAAWAGGSARRVGLPWRSGNLVCTRISRVRSHYPLPILFLSSFMRLFRSSSTSLEEDFSSAAQRIASTPFSLDSLSPEENMKRKRSLF